MFWVAALYNFTRFDDPSGLRSALLRVCETNGIGGTLLLATEGINGTIAGTREGLDAALAYIRTLPGCERLEWKESRASAMPFGRMKVRIKREIVTMGLPEIDPRHRVGHYVDPVEWNRLIRSPDVAVIDTRNDYEIGIGSFRGAIDPGIATFREFPHWWRANAAAFDGKRIAMFCTGGIRCEKASSYLVSEGVAEVYHLKGGILRYLEVVKPEQSLWDGECFVFDRRVSVGHGLTVGGLETCHACRRPLMPGDRDKPEYEEGASCHNCRTLFTEADRDRFRERHRQMNRLGQSATAGAQRTR